MAEEPLVETLSRRAWKTYRTTRAFFRDRFGTASHPYTEITRTRDATEIVLKFPWATKSNDVRVVVGTGYLEIFAKTRAWGAFYRKIEFAGNATADSIKTRFRGGRLMISIPHERQ